jgi:hypothetical protein
VPRLAKARPKVNQHQTEPREGWLRLCARAHPASRLVRRDEPSRNGREWNRDREPRMGERRSCHATFDGDPWATRRRPGIITARRLDVQSQAPGCLQPGAWMSTAKRLDDVRRRCARDEPLLSAQAFRPTIRAHISAFRGDGFVWRRAVSVRSRGNRQSGRTIDCDPKGKTLDFSRNQATTDLARRLDMSPSNP